MSSIFLVRRGEEWLNVRQREPLFGSVEHATAYASRMQARVAADITGGEPVAFREVGGDTAAGALAAAEATIARLMEELETLRNRPSTHELAKRHLESIDDPGFGNYP